MSKVAAVFGIFFGLIGIVMGYLPLGTLAVLPAGIALLCGIAIFLTARKSGKGKTLAVFVTALAGLGLILTVSTEFFGKKSVAEDAAFERKIEKSAEDALSDLEDLFGDEETEKEENKK